MAKKSNEEKLARSKIPREGPPLYFSHPALLGDNPRGDFVQLNLGNIKLRLVAGVSVGALSGAGFIHMFPNKEQIDEIVTGLLELRSKLK